MRPGANPLGEADRVMEVKSWPATSAVGRSAYKARLFAGAANWGREMAGKPAREVQFWRNRAKEARLGADHVSDVRSERDRDHHR